MNDIKHFTDVFFLDSPHYVIMLHIRASKPTNDKL
jgi:hypothetical protein